MLHDLVLKFVLSIWETLLEMSPYLLFGFFVAGLLSIFIKPETVEHHLGGRGAGPVLKAAVFGVPLPLCSCGVIPVAASLRRHGAGRAATTSFLISTPQTGVDSIMVTLSLLGPVFAIFRPIVAFLSGLFGGALVNLFGFEKGAPPEALPVCTAECCSGAVERSSRFTLALKYGFVTLPRDINRALIVGIALAGVISAAIPPNYLSSFLGGGVVSMLIMMAVGIPLYVCATASVPIAAALIAKGVSPGAALVFLMTGPATNAATIATVWKIMGRRIAIIYLFAVAASALAAGLVLDGFFRTGGSYAMSHSHWMMPRWITVACALALIGVLGYAFRRAPKVGESAPAGEPAMIVRFTIQGMTCNHCALAVQRALAESPGVRSAEVDLKKGEATVSGAELDAAELARAIESLGYKVVGTDQSVGST
jgi:hypothetical protein